MKTKAKQLEKELFVSVAGEPGDDYYDVEPKAETLAEMGTCREVGHYRLVEVLAVVGVPKVEVTIRNRKFKTAK